MFIVYDEQMNKKELPQGARSLDIYISSVLRRATTGNVEGRSGIITYGHVDDGKDVTVDVGLLSNDTKDYRLLRDEVYSFFNGHDFLYISESYQKGKRYKVTTTESFIPDRLTREMALATFSFQMYDLPYAESIGTTQDIERDEINVNSELWGFGMGLIADNESLKYTHTGTSFKLFNAGNVPIHPFEQELKIEISNVTGSSDYLELENITNGTHFRVNEGVSSSQEIVIDGANITSNGLQYLRQTNKQFIELDVGWNEFKINGATDAKVSFDFRFYYL